MKVGFIVECCDEGAETKVIPHVVGMVNPAIKPVVVPLRSKRLLKTNCGEVARALLENSACSRVVILWDLLPDFNEYEGRGCRHDDKEQISDSLRSAELDPADPRIQVVCIEKMLEAWIMADERALSAFLSTDAHRVRVSRCKAPESVPDPKAALITLFRKSGSRIRRYVDYEHAIKIVRLLPDLNRLRRSESFCRFEEKLTA
jgi:hypothetical protein